VSLLDALRHRLHTIVRGERYFEDVAHELRIHRDLETLTRSGHALGNETYYREEVRRMTAATLFDRIRQDVTYACRGFYRSPGFTIAFVATLALGLGVNVALYSFMDQLFTRPPAGVVAPAKVARLYLEIPSLLALGEGAFASFSYPSFAAIRASARYPDRVAAFTPSDPRLLVDAAISDSARVIHVSAQYFSVLGLHPVIGRFFSDEDAAVETPAPLAVISERLWRRLYAGNTAALGRLVEIGDDRVRIIGVAPVGFTGIDLDAADVWLPLNLFSASSRDGTPWYRGTTNYLRLIGRFETPSDRAALATSAAVAIRSLHETADSTTAVTLGPLNEAAGPAGPASRRREIGVAERLFAVTLGVLLIACANLTNLLLLRARKRQREVAVRRALGVSNARLVQQMLTEGIFLCLIGGAVTIMFVLWAGSALRHLLLPSTHWSAGAIDANAIALTLGAALIVAVIIGLLPALDATRPKLVESLRASRSVTGGRPSGAQKVLLGLQAAVSVMLLVAAGLVIRSFGNIRSIDLGYATDDMVVATVSIRDVSQARLYAPRLPEVLERVRGIRGARVVSTANVLPMAGYAFLPVFRLGDDHRLDASIVVTDANYFAAAGVRVIAGRALSPLDVAGSERVAVVSERMAREAWPTESALGKCLAVNERTAACSRVVGIVRDAHRISILEEGTAEFYVPASQVAAFGQSNIIVRVDHGQSDNVVAAMRSEMRRLLPSAVKLNVRSMAAVLEPQLRPWKTGAILFGALGVLALLVACVGIYGVVAYSVAQRTHEMGVRCALGARAKDVVNLVLGDGMRVVAVGIVIGAVAALALGRVIHSLLFGVVANDVSTMLGAVAVIVAFASFACLIPAWRASRVDPASALRAD
jgi:predicted permease